MIGGSTTGLTDICLVVPPFDSVHYPQLGTAILKSACVARGLNTRIVYAGIALAKRVGLEAYDAISHGQMKAMVGERLFRPHAYPPATVAALHPLEALTIGQSADFDRLVDAIPPMLDPTSERLLLNNANGLIWSGFVGSPTITIAPFIRSSFKYRFIS